MDLTTGYTFRNQDYLYFLVDSSNPQEEFVQLDFYFQADERRLLISWSPGQRGGHAADITADFKSLGEARNSEIVLKNALEGRIALSDLGSPKNITLYQINVWFGDCCDDAWIEADIWNAVYAPVVNEVEPLCVTSTELKYVVARQLGLKCGYVAEAVMAPPIAAPTDIEYGGDGRLYVLSFMKGVERAHPVVYVFDPQTGESWELADLMSWEMQKLVRAPDLNGILTTWMNPDAHSIDIIQVLPDGTVETILTDVGGTLTTASATGELFGFSADRTQILQFDEAGSKVVAEGFDSLYDIVVSPDQTTLYFSDNWHGTIGEVNLEDAK